MLADLAATRSNLARLAGLPMEAAEFSHEVHAVLARSLPFDGWCLVGMDPVTGLRTAQFSGRGTERTAEMARNESLMHDVNRYRDLAVAALPAGWLSTAHPEAGRSFRLNEILLPQGFHSEIRLVLRDQGRLWGALVLFRESAHRPFDDRDVSTLSALADALTSAMRAYPVRALARQGPAPGPGLVALTPDNQLVEATPDARLWLDDLLPGGEDETHPEDVTRVLFDAAHAVRIAGAEQAATCIRTVSGHWLRVEGTPVSIGAADVAVLVHRATARDLLETYTLHHGLTDRESEVLASLVDGLAGKQIARKLAISLLTVNDHLRSLYRKCQVSGRDELFGRLG
ncbi:GAF domain-containing protein [Nocardioides sp. CGMCC 1.13656]|uniref:LuxR C-terminal-related transcriptional regulator n=1 Tax=Nocardioides TaxID=1839 RepID=UPI0015EC3A21|nr:LuxR C-terminal-related transcriptional regulator [Nocardioides sp. CGMCC 1.13656]MBA2953331.1 GAF domain-containing protein [Nocardioides sp. CGMCC 1.13656]